MQHKIMYINQSKNVHTKIYLIQNKLQYSHDLFNLYIFWIVATTGLIFTKIDMNGNFSLFDLFGFLRRYVSPYIIL